MATSSPVSLPHVGFSLAVRPSSAVRRHTRLSRVVEHSCRNAAKQRRVGQCYNSQGQLQTQEDSLRWRRQPDRNAIDGRVRATAFLAKHQPVEAAFTAPGTADGACHGAGVTETRRSPGPVCKMRLRNSPTALRQTNGGNTITRVITTII